MLKIYTDTDIKRPLLAGDILLSNANLIVANIMLFKDSNFGK